MIPFVLGAVGVFTSAAVSDYRTRTASNRHWVVLAAFGAIPAYLAPTAMYSVLVGVLMGLIIFYTGAAGGADAKALMVSGAFFPNPVLFLAFIAVGALGGLVWVLHDHRRIPLLVPLGASLSTALVMGAVA